MTHLYRLNKKRKISDIQPQPGGSGAENRNSDQSRKGNSENLAKFLRLPRWSRPRLRIRGQALNLWRGVGKSSISGRGSN